MGFSFIHVSDIHLDRPFSDLSKYSTDIKVKAIYKSAVEKAFDNMVNTAIYKSVDFILIAGDTFDSDEQDFESKLILKRALKKLEAANIKVFLICGNHDPLSSYNKITFDFNKDSDIKIVGLNSNFTEDFPVIKNGKEEGVVHCLSFKESSFNDNPLKYFSPKKEGIFNIGLLHCDLDGAKDSPYAPCRKFELESLNYDYWALGHIHIPDFNTKNIKYAGTIQGRNTKETGKHGFWHICVEDGKIFKQDFICSDTVRFEDINLDISNTVDLVEASELLESEINKFQTENCELFLVKVNLTGAISFYNEVNDKFFNLISERIKKDSGDKILISQIYNNTEVKADIELIKNDEGMAGALFNMSDKQEKLDLAYNSVQQKLQALLKECNFNEAEYKDFRQEVCDMVKQTCLNISNSVYNKENKED